MSRNDLLIFIASFFLVVRAAAQDYSSANIAIGFSPNGSISSVICKSITAERGDIFILTSKFSSKALENCLLDIQSPSRKIYIIVDSKFIEENFQKLKVLSKSGVCIYSDSVHHTAHNKVIISGNDFVFSGSYNFTDDSEYKNSENGIFIRSRDVYKKFTDEFHAHLKHSVLVKSKKFTPEQCPQP